MTTTKTTTTRSRKAKRRNTGPSAEERLVNEIVQALESGVSPWRKQWVGNPESSHRNLLTGHEYQGANVALLEMIAAFRGYKAPLWLGAGTAKTKGWFPKKGSTGAFILRPQLCKFPVLDENDQPVKGKDGEPQIQAFVKYKTAIIFNVEALTGGDEASQTALDQLVDHQTRAIPSRPLDERLREAQITLDVYQSQLKGGLKIEGNKAFYQAAPDRITLPERKQFVSDEAFLSTWAHECVHSTGTEGRLNRAAISKGTYHYSNETRAREELVAELGAFLISRRLKIKSDPQNHTAYLGSWAKHIKEGPKALYKVLSDATKASNMICGPEVHDDQSNDNN